MVDLCAGMIRVRQSPKHVLPHVSPRLGNAAVMPLGNNRWVAPIDPNAGETAQTVDRTRKVDAIFLGQRNDI